MSEERKRPSLQSIAAQAPNGWACPRCGCSDWRVENSYYISTDQTRRRRRYCRNCKQILHTREVPVASEQEAIDAANGKRAEDSLTELGIVSDNVAHDNSNDDRRRNRTKRPRS